MSQLIVFYVTEGNIKTILYLLFIIGFILLKTFFSNKMKIITINEHMSMIFVA